MQTKERTEGQCITKLLRGKNPGPVLWVPRLDIWYHANKARKTLPPQYAHSTLDEIIADIGMLHYNAVPDFLAAGEECFVHRGLGIYNNVPEIPYNTVFHGTTSKVVSDNDMVHVDYNTSKGSVSSEYRYTAAMRFNGATVPWITKHVFKRKEDYEILNFIFRNLEVVPGYASFGAHWEKYGDKGVVVACASGSAGPVHYVMRDLMDFTQFFYEMHGRPQKLAELCASVKVYLDQIAQVSVDCPSELMLYGGNFDDTILYPPFFQQHILPYLQEFSGMLHARGKYMVCHCDGENKNLLGLLKCSGMDLAEAICPAPMTKCTLQEIREGLGNAITIMGGIPSTVLSKCETPDLYFRSFIKQTLGIMGNGQRYILSVSDNVPPDTSITCLKTITDLVAAHNATLSNNSWSPKSI